MRADDLLAGPRGRRLCLELAFGGRYAGVPDLPQHAGLLRDEVSRALDDLADPCRAEPAVLDALRTSVESARYWQDPDEIDRHLDDQALTTLIAPVTEALARHPAGTWWTSALMVDRQVITVPDRTSPPPTGPVADALGALHNDTVGRDERMREHRRTVGEQGWASTSSVWWSTPAFAAPSTARVHPLAGPLGLAVVEDWSGWTEGRSWRLAPPGPVRVVEIDGADAWAELVRRHPLDVTFARGSNWLQATGRDGPWALPDWVAVAAAVDAVHLTVAGYLQASGRVIDVGGGVATFLAGWNPDATYWLTDIAPADEEPVRWRRTDDWFWAPESGV